ncbi:SirB1 family protein [Luteimonas deserti]|uniref:SirB1 family protein n=1 Tax=Luteimonas deserti TaxID=2752306 RepID=A0A7Z0TZE8_9GAMM|nr:SirB1 family protein [Luteimonas deserti]NYZ63367.1 SirB1 family protein [Luteimonas deserti]
MTEAPPLPDWNALAAIEDSDLPLFGIGLLIARDEYPGLDVGACEDLVLTHARHLRPEIEAIEYGPLKMQAINRHLFEELGYTGDHERYYDPRNSYLNEVLERRLGNPISLAVVQMEVARRLGVALDGISFPGHFLVRLPVDDGMLVMDPFNSGRPLDLEELRTRAKPHLGGDVPDDDTLARILRPASHRTVLMRMLRNLLGVYQGARDWARVVRCADRLLKLAPDTPDALRDRGLGYLALGHIDGARQDMTRYLVRNPDADDAGELRAQLVRIGGGGRATH